MPSSPKVLALKWRPHNFSEMIGQEHVLPALINSLDQDRLHHAYLFTGTRGVGKTSIARILAKCLNCEQGISSKPCNTCDTCKSIDGGAFIDLIEVDAASRTKVEDTRDLLENVQYSPTQGRFKIYLIDEVHMLSTHSFNALLKTLEEPPPHVKFLLATTDPQKLPITVLSRCLQFHLKHVPAELLRTHFEHILTSENIAFEEDALPLLSNAAKGSVRDGLSLLDQAIAFSHGNVSQSSIQAMLGHIGEDDIWALIQALIDKNANALIECVAKIAQYTSDFGQILESLISSLHRIAVAQFVPDKTDQKSTQFAAALSKESVQLYYQIALKGLSDMALAPFPRAGIEMTLLRMLAFEPVTTGKIPTHSPATSTASTKTSAPAPQPTENTPKPSDKDVAKNWTNIVGELQLTGMAQVLASHCSVASFEGDRLGLLLSIKHKPILNKKLEDRLKTALTEYFGRTITLQIDTGEPNKTPAENRKSQQDAALENANTVMQNDAHVKTLVDVFDAEIQPGSTQAVEKAENAR